MVIRHADVEFLHIMSIKIEKKKCLCDLVDKRKCGIRLISEMDIYSFINTKELFHKTVKMLTLNFFA